MLRTINNRNRRAPIALAADQPIAHFVSNLRLAFTLLLEPSDNLLASILAARTVKSAGIHQNPFAVIASVGVNVILRPLDDLNDWQLEFLGKSKVAVVMRWHAHHRTSAIAPQNIIGNPNWNLLASRRVDSIAAAKNTCFLFGVVAAFNL